MRDTLSTLCTNTGGARHRAALLLLLAGLGGCRNVAGYGTAPGTAPGDGLEPPRRDVRSGDGLEPPRRDARPSDSRDDGVTAPEDCLLQVFDPTAPVTSVWASATRGPYATAAGRLYQQVAGQWNPIVRDPWPVTTARTLDGNDSYVVVGGAGANPKDGYVMIVRTNGADGPPPVTLAGDGPVVDLGVQTLGAVTSVELVTERMRYGLSSPAWKAVRYAAIAGFLPAGGGLTTTLVAMEGGAQYRTMAGATPVTSPVDGFQLIPVALSPSLYGVTTQSGHPWLAGWASQVDATAILVGSGAVAQHLHGSDVQDVAFPSGSSALGVWSEGAVAYAVGPGQIARFDGGWRKEGTGWVVDGSWQAAYFSGAVLDSGHVLRDVTGDLARKKLWIAWGRPSAAGSSEDPKGGVLVCNLP